MDILIKILNVFRMLQIWKVIIFLFLKLKEINICIIIVVLCVDLFFKMKFLNYFGYLNGNVFVNMLKG